MIIFSVNTVKVLIGKYISGWVLYHFVQVCFIWHHTMWCFLDDTDVGSKSTIITWVCFWSIFIVKVVIYII